MTIIPGPLSETIEEFQAAVNTIQTFKPPVKIVQVDIVDGEYADTITFEPGALYAVESTGIVFDLHLMTQEPIDFLGEVHKLPTLRRVIAQVERMDSVTDFLTAVREDLGVEAGISLDLYTQLETVGDDVLDALDQVSVVQVMGNKAGFQGQKLHPLALQTLQQVVEYRSRHNLTFDISVDIGMNAETIPQVKALGATEVVVGSYLQGPDAAKHWQELVALV